MEVFVVHTLQRQPFSKFSWISSIQSTLAKSHSCRSWISVQHSTQSITKFCFRSYHHPWLFVYCLHWLSSYLTGRTQYVDYADQHTEPRHVVYGVPQESVLGPLLFVLYTTEIGNIVEKNNLNHHSFADNSQLYSSCHTSKVPELKARLLSCISEITDWTKSNRLQSIHPKQSSSGARQQDGRKHLIESHSDWETPQWKHQVSLKSGSVH